MNAPRGPLTYRMDWGLIPTRVQEAIYELQEAVEETTDWEAAQITVGEDITIDVQVERNSEET